jgi:hypothetical protein
MENDDEIDINKSERPETPKDFDKVTEKSV